MAPNFFPKETATRTVHDLSGFWKIDFDFDNQGAARFCSGKVPDSARTVSVPGSFNDQFTEARIRDYVGAVYYYKTVRIPKSGNRRYFLRFGSANYFADIYLGTTKIGSHAGGHLPFTLEVPAEFHGQEVLLTASVNNELTPWTVPPADREDLTLEEHGIDKKVLIGRFDFMHYSGLNRKVFLISTEQAYLADLSIKTTALAADHQQATLTYQLQIEGRIDRIRLQLSSPAGETVYENVQTETKGTLSVNSPRLWDVGQGNLYTLTVQLEREGRLVDEWRETFGIRTVRIDGLSFLLNDKPVFFKGCCRHEDFPVFGRYLHEAVLVRDYELMKWLNANSFRTSHYPYSEENMQLADEMGFMVIDEIAVGLGCSANLTLWSDPATKDEATRKQHEEWSLKHIEEHKRLIGELIQRDKNRPCVVMWSLSNEAKTTEPLARRHTEAAVTFARSLDDRPLFTALNTWAHTETVADLYDVIGLNQYPSWYNFPGQTDAIRGFLTKVFKDFYAKYKKPFFLSEFGADTIPGFHRLPAKQWSEEFQIEMLQGCFDVVEKLDFVIGEHIWNFADFDTMQETRRAMGNKKGVFTREREPKAVAYTVREHWRQKG
jgi:beta-glucuronidase